MATSTHKAIACRNQTFHQILVVTRRQDRGHGMAIWPFLDLPRRKNVAKLGQQRHVVKRSVKPWYSLGIGKTAQTQNTAVKAQWFLMAWNSKMTKKRTSIPDLNWLVVSTLGKILVSWDSYSQHMEKQKMFQTTNQLRLEDSEASTALWSLCRRWHQPFNCQDGWSRQAQRQVWKLPS